MSTISAVLCFLAGGLFPHECLYYGVALLREVQRGRLFQRCDFSHRGISGDQSVQGSACLPLNSSALSTHTQLLLVHCYTTSILAPRERGNLYIYLRTASRPKGYVHVQEQSPCHAMRSQPHNG
ncbi:hypothetical protein V8C35DRAFT_9088 [Trichoderma chlorosporum]